LLIAIRMISRRGLAPLLAALTAIAGCGSSKTTGAPTPDAGDAGESEAGRREAGRDAATRDGEGPKGEDASADSAKGHDGGGDARTSDAGGGAGGDACSDPGTLGASHEPSGMSAQLDTGPLTVAPAASGTWTNGSVTFSMFSPEAMTSTGESSANLTRVPCGSGLRLLYDPTLEGGYSPVRFGAPIAAPGTTTYYQRWRVRTVPNWAGPRNGNGVKMCEPQALNQGSGSGAGTNDILMMWPNGGQNDQMSAMEGLQGPDGHFSDLGVNQGLIASLTDGAWHWDERIFVAESSPGAGDGQYLAYYDGTLVASYDDVLWLAPGGTWGINYWTVDPTFGGAPTTTHPLAGDFWDFDELYVSTK